MNKDLFYMNRWFDFYCILQVSMTISQNFLAYSKNENGKGFIAEC